jgi:hypothetical protein
MSAPPTRLADVARARALGLETGAALTRTREVLDRAASELGEVLALELPPALRLRLVAALRVVAGVEALADAIAEGAVRDPTS